VKEIPSQKAVPITRNSHTPIRNAGFLLARWVSAASATPKRMNQPKCSKEY
jgi:hypothetical protein